MSLKPTRLVVSSILALSLSGCISTATIDTSSRPTHWAASINAQNNLHQIAPNLYRSEQPLKVDSVQLQQLKISTVVNLRQRHRDAIELAHSHMQLVHVPINTWSVNEQQIAEALWHIEQGQQTGNVLLHCYHGSDRTGVVTAMYRIIYQNWTIAEAQQEMKHGGFGFHPIWVNINWLFTPEKTENIRQLLEQKRQSFKSS